MTPSQASQIKIGDYILVKGPIDPEWSGYVRPLEDAIGHILQVWVTVDDRDSLRLKKCEEDPTYNSDLTWWFPIASLEKISITKLQRYEY